MPEEHSSDCAVICPHCGYRDRDAWEYTSGDYDCVDCGKEFHVEVNETVTYTTRAAATQT